MTHYVVRVRLLGPKEVLTREGVKLTHRQGGALIEDCAFRHWIAFGIEILSCGKVDHLLV